MRTSKSWNNLCIVTHFNNTNVDYVRSDSCGTLEGDGSVTSTFTVDRGAQKSEKLEEQPRKSVRFDLSSTEEHATDPIDQEEAEALWYTRSEYSSFKKAFIELGRKYQDYDKSNADPQSFKSLLTKAFMTCYSVKDDETEVLLDKDDEKILRKHLKSGVRRGIVRITVLQIFVDKSARRKRLYAAVLGAQKQCQGQSTDEQADSIRLAAEAITLPSRIFARRLAHC